MHQEYVAVGTTNEMDRVTIVINGQVVYLAEDTARKLADDILRNANFLWPVEGADNSKEGVSNAS